MTGAGMAGAIGMVLSSTIANVAVPTVMGAFGVGQDQAQWLATGFVATMVASQLLSAWFARAFGVRGTFVLINCVFFAGTALAFVGASFEMVVLGRVLQGFAAGVMQPMIMALIFTQFPPERRGQAMAIHGTGIQIAPMLGPMIGGLVIDTLGWREIFLVPIPICVVALLLGMVYLPGREEQGRPAPKFDWTGYSLLVAMLASLLFAGANGQRFGWSSDAIVMMVLIGLTAGGAFVWLQLRSASPLLDFSLFRIPQFTSAVIVAFVFGFGNFAANYLVPVTVQQVQGFTPFLSGLLLVPAGVLVILATPIFGRVADIFPRPPDGDARPLPVRAGQLPHEPDRCEHDLPLVRLADHRRALRNGGDHSFAQHLGVARAHLRAAAQRVRHDQFHPPAGGSCGVTALVVFIEQRTQFHVEAMAATQTAGNTTTLELLSKVRALLAEAGVSENLLGPGALHYLGEMIEAQAIARGFNDGFLIIALVFVLAVIPAWNLGKARRRP